MTGRGKYVRACQGRYKDHAFYEGTCRRPGCTAVDITHPDVGVRIIGAEVTPAERVLLKEQVADLQAKLAAAEEALAESEHKRILEDRASIVAFLTAEASRFDEAIKSVGAASGARQLLGEMFVMRDRLIAQAGLLRTLAAQIKRGDDRQGCDAPADSDRAPVRDLLSAAVAFSDADAAWNAATPEDGEWATVEVVESAADKQRTALEALCAAATRAASLMGDRARFGAASDREVER